MCKNNERPLFVEVRSNTKKQNTIKTDAATPIRFQFLRYEGEPNRRYLTGICFCQQWLQKCLFTLQSAVLSLHIHQYSPCCNVTSDCSA